MFNNSPYFCGNAFPHCAVTQGFAYAFGKRTFLKSSQERIGEVSQCADNILETLFNVREKLLVVNYTIQEISNANAYIRSGNFSDKKVNRINKRINAIAKRRTERFKIYASFRVS